MHKIQSRVTCLALSFNSQSKPQPGYYFALKSTHSDIENKWVVATMLVGVVFVLARILDVEVVLLILKLAVDFFATVPAIDALTVFIFEDPSLYMYELTFWDSDWLFAKVLDDVDGVPVILLIAISIKYIFVVLFRGVIPDVPLKFKLHIIL